MSPAKILPLFILMATTTYGQVEGPEHATSSPPYKKQSITLSFGTGLTHSRAGMTSFWDMGYSGSVKFLVNVSKPVSFGVGVDVAQLQFNEQSFQATYPAVPVQSNNIIMSNIYIAMKCMMLPSMRLSPFVGLTLGATHLSDAVYRDIVDSVRVTYYYLPGRTRLTVGLSAGASVYLSHWISIDMEAKSNYVFHDADLGMSSFFRGGFRFTL
jgi:hypothetical protein